jgi:hypothetical protein
MMMDEDLYWNAVENAAIDVYLKSFEDPEDDTDEAFEQYQQLEELWHGSLTDEI